MKHPVDVDDTEGHGTKVATLAAAPANGKGSVGVSPNSFLIVVRITTTGDNPGAGIKCAFNYLAGIAKSGQPLVVNVSSEFPRAPSGAQTALDRLIAAGALVVAAAGNSPSHGPVQWPANADHVVAVGRDDGVGSRGRKLDIVAPGAHLRLPQVDGTWASGADSGTSFSSPIVAGAAARIWASVVDENPQVITYLLRKNATPLPSKFGSGLVNIKAALTAAGKKIPVVQEWEPNDRQSIAQKKSGCARTCTLRGVVSKSDDDSDYWHLVGRSRCPKKLTATGGVTARCIAGHGGVFVRVRARLPLGLYKVTIPRR
jgi:serine protease